MFPRFALAHSSASRSLREHVVPGLRRQAFPAASRASSCSRCHQSCSITPVLWDVLSWAVCHVQSVYVRHACVSVCVFRTLAQQASKLLPTCKPQSPLLLIGSAREHARTAAFCAHDDLLRCTQIGGAIHVGGCLLQLGEGHCGRGLFLPPLRVQEPGLSICLDS